MKPGDRVWTHEPGTVVAVRASGVHVRFDGPPPRDELMVPSERLRSPADELTAEAQRLGMYEQGAVTATKHHPQCENAAAGHRYWCAEQGCPTGAPERGLQERISGDATPVLGECERCDDHHWCFPHERRSEAAAPVCGEHNPETGSKCLVDKLPHNVHTDGLQSWGRPIVPPYEPRTAEASQTTETVQNVLSEVKTCGWIEEDDDGLPNGWRCPELATHHSCTAWKAGPINACEKHKCRCAQPRRERANPVVTQTSGESDVSRAPVAEAPGATTTPAGGPEEAGTNLRAENIEWHRLSLRNASVDAYAECFRCGTFHYNRNVRACTDLSWNHKYATPTPCVTIASWKCPKCHRVNAGGARSCESVGCNYFLGETAAEDEAIAAAHPMRTGRHHLYSEAMRLVGARHAKGDLVDLVTWLLHRIENHEARPAAEPPQATPSSSVSDLDQARLESWVDTLDRVCRWLDTTGNAEIAKAVFEQFRPTPDRIRTERAAARFTRATPEPK